MTTTSKTLLDLARMMIKQARILRDAGLATEARALAARALAVNADGWAQRSAAPVPVRVKARR